jgi:ubiquinone/menaquinone biosynthesis C-methylase UbiE
MKILESAPDRYDRGIRILTLGRLDRVYDRLTSRIQKGQRVLDIGCGTGALTLRAARKGARVRGIDINPQMLKIAQKRIDNEGFARNTELCEMGVAELGSEETESYDVVMSGLCFSELSKDEVNYTLQQIKRLLKPGGRLFIADEVQPGSRIRRILVRLGELPLQVIAWLFTQTTTHAIKDLPGKVNNAGLRIESIRLTTMQNFIELVAMKS